MMRNLVQATLFAVTVGFSTSPGEPAPDCPYRFTPPACENAEPQTPRDLSTGAQGERPAKAAVLTRAQAAKLPQTNVHMHVGAEHKSDYYNIDTDSVAYDAAWTRRRLAGTDGVRPGFMCPTDSLTEAQLQPYTFEFCKNVEVGKSYEVHYVKSSAGVMGADLSDGLGSAANGRSLLNPMVVVNAEVYLVVNDDSDVYYYDNLVTNPILNDPEPDYVMYAGSTTGTSFNNEVCSPYAITWHVDRKCNTVSAKAMDKMCSDMATMYEMSADLEAHGSRKLVDPKWVVPAEEVVPLA